MLGPDALAWRDRHYGQSSCPQGRRRARENRGNRRNAAAPTPLFSRSQSDRAVLRKTQSSPAQVLRTLHPRPLGSNRNNPPDLHSRRVLRLCQRKQRTYSIATSSHELESEAWVSLLFPRSVCLGLSTDQTHCRTL